MCPASDRPSPAPFLRSRRVLLLAVLCGVLAFAQGVAQTTWPPQPGSGGDCTNTGVCPEGEVCCQACGQPDCGRICFVGDECPPFA
jgi:hypothetical protein